MKKSMYKIYEKQILNLIKVVSRKHPEVSNWKIDIDKYCTDYHYRWNTNYRLKSIEKIREYDRNRNRWEYRKKYNKEWFDNHPQYSIRKSFERWTINNPRRAMLAAAASHMSLAVINKLWIRPAKCPHCGKEHCKIDFHHPNHLFWWKWTFCCKSCHYFFNKDKVPASDKIIDLKKLLRESISQ